MRPPTAVTNAVSWRSTGIKHERNEVVLDVVESLRQQLSSDGSVLRSELTGTLSLVSHLSGMPELKLKLNDKLHLAHEQVRRLGSTENFNFHQCVRPVFLSNTISCIPPDGEFRLLSYELTTPMRPPIQVKTLLVPSDDPSQSRYDVLVVSCFRAQLRAHDVDIRIPLPPNSDCPIFEAPTGVAEYMPEQRLIIWRIGQLPGKSDLLMSISFTLPRTRAMNLAAFPREAPAIEVNFNIPGWLASGLQVQALKVIEKSGYQSTHHTRYLTRCQDCKHRLQPVG